MPLTGVAGASAPASFDEINVRWDNKGSNFETIYVSWGASGEVTETSISIYEYTGSTKGALLTDSVHDSTSGIAPEGDLSSEITHTFSKFGDPILIEITTVGPAGSQSCTVDARNPQQMGTNLVVTYDGSVWNDDSSTHVNAGCGAVDEPFVPQDVTTSDGTTSFTEGDTAVIVDPDLIVAGTNDYLSATVSIGDGFDRGVDVLAVDDTYDFGSSPIGLVGYNSTTGVMKLDGTASASEYQAVLRNVTYDNTELPPSTADRNVTYTLRSANESIDDNPNVVYNPNTDRYYEYVEHSDVSWTEAKNGAVGRTYAGMTGYLATLTSQEENDFLLDKFQAGGWIGASDSASEGEWRWVTGPEGDEVGGDGRHFFDQTAAHVAWTDPYPAPPTGVPGGGEAVDGEYANWDPRHEPDNKFPFFGGQDYAYFCFGPGSCPDGMWKDASTDSPPFTADGYFVEYGGWGTEPDTQTVNLSDSKLVTVSVASSDETPPTANAGSDQTVSPDQEFTLDASGSTSSGDAIVRYEWDIDGNGRTDLTGQSVTTSFSNASEYTVMLTVTDSGGDTDTDTVVITVEDTNSPTAVISVDGSTTVQRGEKIQFTGTNSTDDIAIESFEWDFGDGSTNSSEVSPTHSYDVTGTYTVTLVVNDTSGNQDTATVAITVETSTFPKIHEFTATNPTGTDLEVSVTSDMLLDELTVTIYDTSKLTPGPDDSDALVYVIDTADFGSPTESDGNVTFLNTTTVMVGDYTARLETAKNATEELDSGAGQEATVSITSDSTAPSFASGYPTTRNPTTDSFEIAVQADEGGTAYWVVVGDGSGEPSTTQVLSGENGDGDLAIASGSESITADTEHVFTVSDLGESTDYDVYVVVEDAAGNARKSSTIETSTVDGSGPTLSSPSLLDETGGNGVVTDGDEITISVTATDINGVDSVTADVGDFGVGSSVSLTDDDDDDTYDATVTVGSSGPSTEGTHSVTITATDTTGNSNSATTGTLDVDTTAPSITGMNGPTDGEYATGETLTFTVEYDEVVAVSGTPFIKLDVGGTTKQAPLTGGSDTRTLTFEYTVQSGDSDGDGIAFAATAIGLDGGSLTDTAGNDADTEFGGVAPDLSGVTVSTDSSAPTIDGASIATDNSFVELTFSEGVYTGSDGTGGLTPDDFTYTFNNNGGAATDVSIDNVKFTSDTSLSGGETSVRVSISVTDGPAAGVETVEIAPTDGSSIYDHAGNAMDTSETTDVLTLKDRLAPSISSVSLSTDGAGNLAVSFQADEQLAGDPSAIAVSADGPHTSAVYTFDRSDFDESESDGTYTYTLTTSQTFDDGDGTYTVTIDDAVDESGNDGSDGTATDTYDFDGTVPTVASITRKSPSNSLTNAGSVTFTVTFSEAVDAIDTADFTAHTVSETASGSVTGVSTSSGTSVEVTVGSITGDGTLGLDISTGTDIQDGGGNTLDGSEPSTDETYTVDNTAPTINSITAKNPSGQDVLVTIETTEQLGSEAGDFTVSITGPETATLTGDDFTESGSGPYTYTATHSSSTDGTYTATVDTATDDAGNDGASGESDSVTIDTTGPGSAPSPVTATASSGGDIDVTFSDVDDGTTTYSIRRSTNSGGPYTEIATVADDAGESYTYTDTGTSDGQTFYYVVVPVDGSGNVGTHSSVASATADATAPSGFVVSWTTDPISSSNDDAAAFDITGGEDGATYDYTISTSGGSGTITGSGTVSGLSESVSGVDVSGLADGTLTISVSLIDDAGNEGPAATDTVAKDTTGPNSAPSSVIATAVSGGDIAVTFGDANDGTATYSIRRSTTSGSDYSEVATISDDNSPSYTFTDTGTSDGTTYYYVVVPLDNFGNAGSPSSEASATADATAPTINSISATNPSGQDVQVEIVTTEQLGSGDGNLSISITGPETATLTGDDVTKSGTGPYTYTAWYAGSTDGTYTATVDTAKDAAGNDGASGESDSVTIDTTGPPAPGSITATALAGGDIEVSFDDVDDGTVGYTLYRNDTETSAGFESVSVITDHDSERYTYTDAGLADGSTYEYRISATDGAGNEGDTSSTVTATADGTAPTITDFTVTNPSGTVVNVSVESDEPLAVLSVSISGDASATLTEFQEHGTTYYAKYDVGTEGTFTATLETATDAVGNDGANSDVDSVTIDTAVDFNLATGDITAGVITSANESSYGVTVDLPDTHESGSMTITLDDGSTVVTETTGVDEDAGAVTIAGIDASGLEDGTVTIRATFTDPSNNAEEANTTVTKDTVAPVLGDFTVSNPSGNAVEISFTTAEPLSAIEVVITGAESETLDQDDFSAVDNGDGTYRYTATHVGLTDGTYTATLNTATDAVGNDGADSDADSVEVDTTGPAAPTGLTATAVTGGVITITFEDVDEGTETYSIRRSTSPGSGYTERAIVPDADTATYTHTDTDTSDGATYYYVVVAIDDVGNEGEPSSEVSATADATAPSISTFTLTNPTDQTVALTIETDERLGSIAVSGTDDASGTTLSGIGGSGAFTETSESGTYTYTATLSDTADGTFGAHLDTATDAVGNDGADGQHDAVRVDTTAPSIPAGSFTVSNPAGQDVTITFNASEELSSIQVAVTNAIEKTLDRDDVTERANPDGTYTYVATVNESTDGTYKATLTAAADAAGNDGASGQSESVTVDTTAPALSNLSVSNPSGTTLSIAFESSEPLEALQLSITGAESGQMNLEDFAETGSGPYTYTATYTGSANGTYTATLQSARDVAGNDGATGTNASVAIGRAVLSSDITYVSGTHPEMANLTLDSWFAGGLLQVQVRNATADASDISTEEDYELSGVGADESTRLRLNVTVQEYVPRALVGTARGVDWSRTNNGDGTWTVAISGHPAAVESVFEGDGSPPTTWPGTLKATESQTAAMTFAIDSLGTLPTTYRERLNGSSMLSDAQELGLPRYNDSGPVDRVELHLQAPHFATDGSVNDGFFEAFLPQALLDAWDVDAAALVGEFQGSERATIVQSTTDGVAVSFDVHYSAGDAAVTVDTTPPRADAGENLTVDEGVAVPFDGSNTSDNAGVDGYAWDVDGDGTADLAGSTPTHTFGAPGTYTVTLTATDVAGNTDSDTVIVTVRDTTTPTADAGSDVTADEDAPLEFDATNSSDNVGISNYTWDFGDGTVAKDGTSRPTHTYADPDTYTVTLTVTDEAGNTETDTLTATIRDVTSPTADAGPSRAVDEDTSVVFDASNSTDNGVIASYHWEFGDGSAATGATVNYAFADPGTYTVTLTVTDGVGNVGTDTAVVTVADTSAPTADAGTDRTVEEDSRVTFDASNSTDNGVISSYEWTFDDGSGNNSGVMANHTFTDPGEYSVTLTVTDNAGNTATETVAITVTDETAPHPNGSANKTASVHEAVTFDASNSTDNVGITTFEWDFGDGAAANGSTVTHTYTELGEFTVALVVTDDSGNAATDHLMVTVEDTIAPSASAGSNSTVDEDTLVTFDATNSSDNHEIGNFTWDFGDGTVRTDAGPTPVHTYPEPGTYRVTLTVTDRAGNVATDSLAVTVLDTTAPTARVGSNVSVSVGTAASFNGSASTDTVGIVNYTWAFGDGTTLVDAGPTPSHTYSTPGRYTVTLTVTDAAGNAAIDTLTVTVVDTTPPSASAGSDVTSTINSVVLFDASNSTDNVGIATFEWDFGDGANGTGVTPTHDYEVIGTFTVTLTVTDEAGNRDVDLLTVTVQDPTPPTADAGQNRSVDEDSPIQFTAANSSDNHEIDGYHWDFGDGATSTDRSPVHSYTDPGAYTVHLTVTDSAGNSAVDTIAVSVADTTPPMAVAGRNVSVDEDVPVRFNGSNSSDNVGIETYVWEFGDGTTGTGATVSHTYVEPGTYTVTLTTTDAAANVGNDTLVVTVVDTTPPTALAGSNVTVDEDTAVSFDASNSTDNDVIANYSWDFGDGTVSMDAGATPSHTFEDSGTYTVTLTVTDPAGNDATDILTVTVDDATAPTIADGNVTLTNPAVRNLSVRIDASELLDAIEVRLTDDTGSLVRTFTTDDFATVGADGVHSYVNDSVVATDGTYTATLVTARDAAGNDGAVGQNDTVTVATAANFSVSVETTSSPVSAGETLSVNGWVTNVGDATGTQPVTLTDFSGSDVDSGPVTLAPGASTKIVLKWTTSDDDIGSGSIAVESANDTATAAVTVEQAAVVPGSLTATLADGNVPSGTATSLVVEADFTNATTLDVTTAAVLGSTDTEIATLDADGTVRAVGEGSATLNAAYRGETASASLDVTAAVVESLAATLVEAKPEVGRETSLRVTATYTNGTSRAVTTAASLASNDTSVATVAADGTVTAHSVGRANLSAEYDGTKAAAVVEVTPDVTDPTAVAGSNRTVREDVPTTFDATNSSDNDVIANYSWDFGDGTTGTGATVHHTYDDPGTYTVTLTVTDGAGNSDSTSMTVTVSDETLPSADAGANQMVAIGAAVAFDASNSTDNHVIATYKWDFGDGITTTGIAPTHAYSVLGSYTVTLTVIDAAGNVATDTITVDVEDTTAPTADAGSNVTTDEDVSVLFDGSSSTDNDAIANYTWNFGDGTILTDTGPAPSHTFADPGTYTVTLTVTDAANNVGTGTTVVTVTDTTAPTADAGSDRTVEEDTRVTFDASNSTDNHEIATYEWDFGDGAIASTAVANYTFAQPGTFTVTLTVTDDAGNSDRDVLTVSVLDTTDPTASAGSDITVAEDTIVRFDGSASTDNVGVTGYEWTFGDGTTGTGAAPTHVFTTPGHYSVTLLVTDATGRTDTGRLFVTVTDETVPVATVDAPTTVDEDTSVVYDARNATDNVAITNYSWTFGDGHSGQGAVVAHSYSDPGTYSVALTVTDAAGNTNTTRHTVTVDDVSPPNAIAAAAFSVAEDTSIDFDATNSTDNVEISSYAWDFGDGETASGVTASHAYDDAGRYTVRLTVTDTAGNRATDTLVLTVRESSVLVANAGSNRTIAEDTALTFTGSGSKSNEGFARYDWQFGDDTSASENTVTHEYAEPGRYRVTLTVTDTEGNVDTDSVTVTVTDETSPVAVAGTDITTEEDTWTSFDATNSTDNGAIVTYLWAFGDGTTVAGATPDHRYDDPGEYAATLTVIDGGGNRATDTVNVTVQDVTPPAADAGPNLRVDEDVMVEFNASGSTDNVGISNYTWTFTGENATSATPSLRFFGSPTSSVLRFHAARLLAVVNQATKIVSGPTANNTYPDSGTYGVTLTVEDTSGNTGDDSVTVFVNETSVLVVDAGSDQTVPEDTQISFSGAQSESNEGIASARWQFGDGTGGSGLSATHTYAAPGIYTARLTLTDTEGNAANDTIIVHVTDTTPPTADAGGDRDVDEDESITFDATNSADNVGVTEYRWDLGDGTITNGPSLTHVYSTPGNYTVALTATDAAGNRDRSSVSVTVRDVTRPTARAGEDRIIDEESSIRFNATASTDNVAITSYAWDFGGDGITDATGPTPSHTFLAPGTYTVALTVADSAGNTANDTLTVIVEAAKEEDPEDSDDREDEEVQTPTPSTPIPTVETPVRTTSAPTTPTTEQTPVETPTTAELPTTVPVTPSPTDTPSQSTGTGDGPELDVEPTVLRFDEIPPGSRETLVVTVENLVTASSDLTVDTTKITGRDPGAFAIVGGGAPFTLAPGESRALEIAFEPDTVGTKEAQLQIQSNARTGQIDVWLTNSRAYIVVQEVASDEDRPERIVNIDAHNIERDSRLVVNVSRPSIRALPASVDTLSMRVDRGGNFSLNVTHSAEPLDAGHATFAAADESPIQYVTLDYTIPGESFRETSFLYRVDADRLPADAAPASVNFYRYADGSWTLQSATFVRRSGSSLVYRADTDGFSQFVVTAPTTAESRFDFWWLLLGVVVIGLVVLLLLFAWRRDDEEDSDDEREGQLGA